MIILKTKNAIAPVAPQRYIIHLTSASSSNNCRFFVFYNCKTQSISMAPKPARRATRQLMSLAKRKLLRLSARSGIDECPS